MRWVRAVPGVILVAACGCGSDQVKTAPVTGRIVYAGKPVPNGTITFVPSGPGPSASGELRSDGTYTLKTYTDGDGAILGSHKIMIVALEDMGSRLPEDRNPAPPPIIPGKYTSYGTSGLTAEVKDGPNTIDFELKDDKAVKSK